MCDALAVSRGAATTGTVLFAKNSDRPAFESQVLLHEPARRHPASARIRLAYMTVPQARRTLAHLGSAPYWCWGYEMGLNEAGVAIGNEAIYTRPWRESVERARRGRPPRPGLLGMEVVRLALERAESGREALDVATGLVEDHGQWGAGTPGRRPEEASYDNSFLIADPREAWVLEASGREWAARRVGRAGAISNELTIRRGFDRASPSVLRAGRARAKSGAPFDFAASCSDPLTPLQTSHIRIQRSRQLLAEGLRAGGVSPEWLVRILRDHYEGTFLGGPYFNAALPDFLTLCMHDLWKSGRQREAMAQLERLTERCVGEAVREIRRLTREARR